MPALTKFDIKALRQADDICVHLGGPGYGKDGAVRAIKRKPTFSENPFDADKECLISAEVGLETMEGAAAIESGTGRCFAMVGLYHSQKAHASAIMHTLREGDELKFSFYPDAHSNDYLAAAGIHGDALFLHVRRKGKTVARWELTTSCCPQNSARMCRDFPATREFLRAQDRARGGEG